MRDLKELLVSCGGDLDNEFVTIPETLNPLNIVIKVQPVAYDFEDGVVVFRVLVADKLEGSVDGSILHSEYGPEDLSLPLHAVELSKSE